MLGKPQQLRLAELKQSEKLFAKKPNHFGGFQEKCRNLLFLFWLLFANFGLVTQN